MPKNSEYKGYTSYFVNIIPKKPIKYDICFQPSDKETGVKCQANEKIKIIDGASFYDLVTDKEDSLQELFFKLPQIIQDVFGESYGRKFILPDQTGLISFFTRAYKNY